MAHKVIYKDKSGKPTSTTFPTAELANAYARNIKGARVESSAADAPSVEVQRCPEGSAEAQRAATRAYYAPIEQARKGVVVAEREERAENETELMMEHFADARAAGQSHEDAWADWDHLNRRGRR